jgi:colicin import membrane protein
MSTQPDGMNDLLSRDLQAAMAVAGRWGEMMARQRAEQVRQRLMEQQYRRRELEERFEAERAVMRTELAPVDQDRFWETAKPADIAGHYGLARQWENHDEVAKAARGRIETEVKDRHGLSVEDYLNDHAPQRQRTGSPEHELAARESIDAQRDHAEASRNAAVAAQGDLQNDTDTRHAAAEAEELWDSGDRRARLSDSLMAVLGGTEAGRDGVQARLAAERDQGTPPIEAVRSIKRGPKARKNTGRGAGRERDMGLG